MSQVFVYETLKHKRILEQALGTNHGKVMVRAILPRYEEVFETDKYGDRWPTLTEDRHYVKGDIIQVDDSELKKLDEWENKYKRKEVVTSEGKAWTYVYTGSKAA